MKHCYIAEMGVELGNNKVFWIYRYTFFAGVPTKNCMSYSSAIYRNTKLNLQKHTQNILSLNPDYFQSTFIVLLND